MLLLGYAAALAASGTLSVPLLLLAGFGLAVAVELLRWRGVPDAAAILLFWAPLHLLVVGTGSLASPVLPLAAAWVVAVGLFGSTYALGAATAGSALLLLGTIPSGETVAVPDALRMLLLLGLAGTVPRFFGLAAAGAAPPAAPGASRPARAAIRRAASSVPGGGVAAAAPEPPRQLLHLVRRATGATEAILWEQANAGGALRPLGWAMAADGDPPLPVESASGHPYAWALREGSPVRLERGRKPLPRSAAAEMLLLPFAQGSRLLTLSYATAAPDTSEAAAVAAVGALEEFGARVAPHGSPGAVTDQGAAAGDPAREGGEGSAAPLQIEPFAASLARACAELTHAQGGALVLWDAESGTGSVVALAGSEPAIDLPAVVEAGESYAAEACGSGRAARLDDRDREPEPLPLLAAVEEWSAAPRSVLARPIRSETGAIGALLAWDSTPNHFHLRDEEGVELLASIAAPVLQQAVRESPGVRGGAPPLADRPVFEARLTGLCGRFNRYSRPFAVVAIDIDHLGRINESWGKEVGTLALQHVATLVRNALREVDLLARPDGREFLVLLPETTLEAALSAAERIRHALETTHLAANGRHLALTASFGVAACPEPCTVATDTVAAARRALQCSKKEGRNRVSAATPRR